MKLKLLFVTIGVIIAAGSVWYIFNGGKDTSSTDENTTSQAASTPANQSASVFDQLKKQKDNQIFVGLLETSGVSQTLQSAGPYTVFAPTDTAFKALPDGLLDTLKKPENKEKLALLLNYHIVKGSLAKDTLQNDQKLPTLANNDVVVKISDNTLYIVDMKAEQAEVFGTGDSATNGISYGISAVLLTQ